MINAWNIIVQNIQNLENFYVSPFHKTLPKSSLKVHWISVRFYEMGVKCTYDSV